MLREISTITRVRTNFASRRLHISARLRGHVLLVALLVAATIFFAPIASHLVSMAGDDAFIHRRIAFNYLHFGKPYFNVDQRVMATSSPLWTVLITAASAILPVANPVPFLEWFFLLAGASGAYLLLRDGAETSNWLSLALPSFGFFLICISELTCAIDQMETPCAIALMLFGLLGVFRKKSWGMALLLLACFTRYECSLLFVATAGWLAFRRQWTRTAALACLSVFAIGVGWMLVEFHTVIPNTMIAKSRLYRLSWRDTLSFTITSKDIFLEYLELGLIWWLNRRDRCHPIVTAAALLIGFGILLNIAYISQRALIFGWYLPLIFCPICVGILLMADSKHLRGALPAVVLGFTLILPFFHRAVMLVHAANYGITQNYPDYFFPARVHEYERIGAALYSTCPSGILMTSEIGGLGWTFHGKILDGAGLASPEAIKYHPMPVPQERSSGGNGEIPPGFVRERHPDLIVSYEGLGESAIPAARALGYVDYTYPALLPQEIGTLSASLASNAVHVMVAPDGRCSPAAVDRAIRMAFSR
jgi:hypothetical protein